MPHLVIHRKQGPEVRRLRGGATTHPGDIVQVSYVAAGNHHGVVLSVDGAGAVTLHHPLRPRDSTAVRPRGEHPLAHAFQLDDAPGFERFFFVTSAQAPIDVEVVLAAAERLTLSSPLSQTSAALDLPPSLQQRSLLLRKSP